MSAGFVTPVENARYFPGEDARTAPPLCVTLRLAQARMQTEPELVAPVIAGRDARLFPQVSFSVLTVDGVLVSVPCGEMVRESGSVGTPSYWDVIVQYGRVWCEAGEGGWARAALPIMLVNDTENHAHQGLLTFLYKEDEIGEVRFQFVEQTAPYLLRPHFVAWGVTRAEWIGAGPDNPAELAAAARAELGSRLPSRPWSALLAGASSAALTGFGGPLHPKWQVASALVKDGVLYYQQAVTRYGPYPYPLEMRFGVRSVMKSVGVPLALLRLAQVYGPYVLTLKVGDYVPGLDPRYRAVRFIDAADMASGLGGFGSWNSHPNDINDGYLGGDYDGWYTAASHEEKIARINKDLGAYPWQPGTVVRYRDQDFYLLGVAIDGFLKAARGSDVDVWDMLRAEVFAPLGIFHAPVIRTREANGRSGFAWFNAGYYPTLDELAKIALLYLGLGAWNGQQILHRQLTEDLLSARDALVKSGDGSLGARLADEGGGLYKMGFHFNPYTGAANGRRYSLPTMWGSGESEVVLYPNRMISLRIGKAAQLPQGERAFVEDGPLTARAVERLAPF
jgi:hypothetical protein